MLCTLNLNVCCKESTDEKREFRARGIQWPTVPRIGERVFLNTVPDGTDDWCSVVTDVRHTFRGNCVDIHFDSGDIFPNEMERLLEEDPRWEELPKLP